MENLSYTIKFNEEGLAQANIYSDELREVILELSANKNIEVEAEILRDSPTTMDFGGTLAIILGTSAVVEIAKGIGNWLSKRNSASITIVAKNGKVVVENISAKDASSLADRWLQNL